MNHLLLYVLVEYCFEIKPFCIHITFNNPILQPVTIQTRPTQTVNSIFLILNFLFWYSFICKIH